MTKFSGVDLQNDTHSIMEYEKKNYHFFLDNIFFGQ